MNFLLYYATGYIVHEGRVCDAERLLCKISLLNGFFFFNVNAVLVLLQIQARGL